MVLVRDLLHIYSTNWHQYHTLYHLLEQTAGENMASPPPTRNFWVIHDLLSQTIPWTILSSAWWCFFVDIELTLSRLVSYQNQSRGVRIKWELWPVSLCYCLILAPVLLRHTKTTLAADEKSKAEWSFKRSPWHVIQLTDSLVGHDSRDIIEKGIDTSARG